VQLVLLVQLVQLAQPELLVLKAQRVLLGQQARALRVQLAQQERKVLLALVLPGISAQSLTLMPRPYLVTLSS